MDLPGKVHDCTSGVGGKTVTLVVRQGNRYGSAGPGERVLVDAGETLNKSTMDACMLEEDYAAWLAEREKAAKPPEKPAMVRMVEEGLERIKQQAEAKAKAKAEAADEAPPPAPETKLPSKKGERKK